jgi:hypothetical protein
MADFARFSFVVNPPANAPPPWPITLPTDWHSTEGTAVTTATLLPDAVSVVAEQLQSAAATMTDTILFMVLLAANP